MGYKSRICIVIAICFTAGLLAGCVSAPPPDDQDQDDVLTQVSTIDAILNGLYDGVITYGDLKEHGDFGIGTFEGLDGEMVALDGNFYQIRDDGVAYPVGDDMTAPFACVLFFDRDQEMQVWDGMNYTRFKDYMDDSIREKNIFHAVRMGGNFRMSKQEAFPGRRSPTRLWSRLLQTSPPSNSTTPKAR